MKHRFFYVTAILITISLNSGTIHAQNFWQQTNGPYGGNVYCVATDTTGTIYAGLDCGVIKQSTDYGQTWESLNPGNCASRVTSIFAESPQNIFAIIVDSIYHIAHSTNDGKQWIAADSGLLNYSYPLNPYGFYKISKSPRGMLFAATQGGLFLSTNEGNNWVASDTSLNRFPATSLAITSKGDIFIGNTEGIFLSTDNGKTWNFNEGSITGGDIYDFAIGRDSSIWAATEALGVILTTDYGSYWFGSSSSAGFGRILSITLDSNEMLFAGSDGGYGLRSSKDGGNNWNSIDSEDFWGTSVGSIITDKQENIYIATSGQGFGSIPQYSNGLLRSTDNGITWGQVGFISSYVQCFAFDSSGEQYAGAQNGVFVSSDKGNNWRQINHGLLDKDVKTLLVDNNNALYAGTDSGVYRYVNTNNSWELSGLADSAITSLTMNFNGYMYAGTSSNNFDIGDGIFISTDHGLNWVRVNDAFPEIEVGSLIVDSDGTIIAGSLYNGIWQSKDGGMSWSKINNYDINCLVKDKFGYVYAGTWNGIIRSTDNGDSWEVVNAGLGSDTLILSITADRYGAIYTGTAVPNDYGGYYVDSGMGVFKSTDKGLTWNSTGNGLPNDVITALGVDSQGYIYAGTSQNAAFRSINAVASVAQSSPTIPSALSLQQNYPNPFSPSTNISFSLPRSGYTALKIYDALGKEVSTAFSGNMNAGEYSIPWEAKDLPDGIYYYRLTSGTTTETKKLVLMK
jgi:ligand-binding sensor domain-containing protein